MPSRSLRPNTCATAMECSRSGAWCKASARELNRKPRSPTAQVWITPLLRNVSASRWLNNELSLGHCPRCPRWLGTYDEGENYARCGLPKALCGCARVMVGDKSRLHSLD